MEEETWARNQMKLIDINVKPYVYIIKKKKIPTQVHNREEQAEKDIMGGGFGCL